MDMKEKLLENQNVFSGKVFDIYIEDVLLSDGNTAYREIVKHTGGVCVIPLDKDFVYMVKQYRRGVDDVCIEFPAGKLNAFENHYEAGLRELKEEIGATADIYKYLGEIYPTPAYCSEKIHLYIADGLKIGEQSLDEDEILSVERIKINDLIDMVQCGKIKDAKTIIGTYKLLEYIK